VCLDVPSLTLKIKVPQLSEISGTVRPFTQLLPARGGGGAKPVQISPEGGSGPDYVACGFVSPITKCLFLGLCLYMLPLTAEVIIQYHRAVALIHSRSPTYLNLTDQNAAA
jgi:hypothetical protein